MLMSISYTHLQGPYLNFWIYKSNVSMTKMECMENILLAKPQRVSIVAKHADISNSTQVTTVP